jgi:DNA-3-methyladenine glycosylase I
MAFDHFDPEKVAEYDERKIQELLLNPGIIRNKAKNPNPPHRGG